MSLILQIEYAVIVESNLVPWHISRSHDVSEMSLGTRLYGKQQLQMQKWSIRYFSQFQNKRGDVYFLWFLQTPAAYLDPPFINLLNFTRNYGIWNSILDLKPVNVFWFQLCWKWTHRLFFFPPFINFSIWFPFVYFAPLFLFLWLLAS